MGENSFTYRHDANKVTVCLFRYLTECFILFLSFDICPFLKLKNRLTYPSLVSLATTTAEFINILLLESIRPFAICS